MQTRRSAPMLVMRHTNANIETVERAAITAIQWGHGTDQHFNLLNDLLNLLLVATQKKQITKYKSNIDKWTKTLQNMQARYVKTGRIGFNADDKARMTDMVNFYGKFWELQTTDFYQECDAEVRLFYQAVKDCKKQS